MSFIQLDRIGAVLRDGFNHPNRAELYARPSRLCFGLRSRRDSLRP